MTAFQALEAGDPERVGRYQVLARLGSGGMGRVFLARSPGGRPVAVKVVRAELAEDPQFRGRFAREVAAARCVNGFFTAGVVDADPEGTPPWLATAYVPGLPLNDAVTAHGPWPEASVRALGGALAEALEAIHAAGVVHRDLKPSNVLLAGDGPRVIDFGISLAITGTSLTQTGAIVGTPGFIAPEQLRGAGAGPASDVFALGAVLVYAVTGTGPFGSGLAHEVNFRAAYEPADLTRMPDGGLRELVGRCLEKDPERRPGVAELVERLGDDAGGLAALDWLPEAVAGSVRTRTDTPPPARGPSRRRALAIAGGVAGVAGLGALTYALTTSGGGDGGGGGSDGGGDSATNGGDTYGDGSSGEPTTVRIAVQGPLTGENADVGRDMLASVQLAADLANESGDHPGLRFEVFAADDQGTADAATAAARAAIDDGRVLAVVGPAYSGTAQAAGPLYSAAGLAAVSPLVTSPEFAGQRDFATFLRGVPNDRQAGAAIGSFLAGSAAVVIDDASAPGRELADAVVERLREAGSYARRSAPFEDAAQYVVEATVDAVAFCGSLDQAGELAVALRDKGYTGDLVGGEGLMGRRFLSAWQDASEGWYLVSHRFDSSVSEEGRRFAQLFEEANGRRPGHYSARTFDVAALIIEAVAGAGREADREAAFEAVAGHRLEGVTGLIAFDSDGDYAGDGPQLFQVQNGEFAPLGPVEDHTYEP
ncbi:bifunctional serine/threonine-protein kinase/ABC transporter substrate-binding protein [Streptomyces johnsoniae]|uniref:Bifunctional serine/threonine-protein kinase/ABC transporter substrate-binding protein n=1 Tax=Streptomyces johnsoniae TaxID=3075532 RepID=A0ABU2RY80_9ACTN|nr:bifunctional serine/threonine-protein kinase/ABC transporter substrate-binding protein [Streptomyces sp. DSM 41886]MDT0441376.1 bifunctional serine/threonine-protein kinase/ABC transporter substrate-binding protein [Streptomyces sp. DSM 41886]